MRQQHNLLSTIHGIPHTTTCWLIAELGDMCRFDNVRAVVAYVGLKPQQQQSGKKCASHGISKTEYPSLLATLYMPATVAKTHNPLLQAFAQRLINYGLRSKQIIVAVIRKLLHLWHLKIRLCF